MKTIFFSLLLAIAGSIPGLSQVTGTSPFVLSVTLTGTTASCTFTAAEVGYSFYQPIGLYSKNGVVYGISPGTITIVKVPDSCSDLIAKTLLAGQQVTGVITVSQPIAPGVATVLEKFTFNANILSVSRAWPNPTGKETLVLNGINLNVTGM
jgi:hypothetical protein